MSLPPLAIIIIQCVLCVWIITKGNDVSMCLTHDDLDSARWEKCSQSYTQAWGKEQKGTVSWISRCVDPGTNCGSGSIPLVSCEEVQMNLAGSPSLTGSACQPHNCKCPVNDCYCLDNDCKAVYSYSPLSSEIWHRKSAEYLLSDYSSETSSAISSINIANQSLRSTIENLEVQLTSNRPIINDGFLLSLYKEFGGSPYSEVLLPSLNRIADNDRFSYSPFFQVRGTIYLEPGSTHKFYFSSVLQQTEVLVDGVEIYKVNVPNGDLSEPTASTPFVVAESGEVFLELLAYSNDSPVEFQSKLVRILADGTEEQVDHYTVSPAFSGNPVCQPHDYDNIDCDMTFGDLILETPYYCSYPCASSNDVETYRTAHNQFSVTEERARHRQSQCLSISDYVCRSLSLRNGFYTAVFTVSRDAYDCFTFRISTDYLFHPSSITSIDLDHGKLRLRRGNQSGITDLRVHAAGSLVESSYNSITVEYDSELTLEASYDDSAQNVLSALHVYAPENYRDLHKSSYKASNQLRTFHMSPQNGYSRYVVADHVAIAQYVPRTYPGVYTTRFMDCEDTMLLLTGILDILGGVAIQCPPECDYDHQNSVAGEDASDSSSICKQAYNEFIIGTDGGRFVILEDGSFVKSYGDRCSYSNTRIVASNISNLNPNLSQPEELEITNGSQSFLQITQPKLAENIIYKLGLDIDSVDDAWRAASYHAQKKLDSLAEEIMDEILSSGFRQPVSVFRPDLLEAATISDIASVWDHQHSAFGPSNWILNNSSVFSVSLDQQSQIVTKREFVGFGATLIFREGPFSEGFIRIQMTAKEKGSVGILFDYLDEDHYRYAILSDGSSLNVGEISDNTRSEYYTVTVKTSSDQLMSLNINNAKKNVHLELNGTSHFVKIPASTPYNAFKRSISNFNKQLFGYYGLVTNGISTPASFTNITLGDATALAEHFSNSLFNISEVVNEAISYNNDLPQVVKRSFIDPSTMSNERLFVMNFNSDPRDEEKNEGVLTTQLREEETTDYNKQKNCSTEHVTRFEDEDEFSLDEKWKLDDGALYANNPSGTDSIAFLAEKICNSSTYSHLASIRLDEDSEGGIVVYSFENSGMIVTVEHKTIATVSIYHLSAGSMIKLHGKVVQWNNLYVIKVVDSDSEIIVEINGYTIYKSIKPTKGLINSYQSGLIIRSGHMKVTQYEIQVVS